ncbi:MAG: CHAT domain-containing protein, partial [Ginsengibacter sp.]
QLSNLDENDPAYEKEQLKLFEAKEALSHYIKTIEKKYPQYYQYKYADAVPGLAVLQKYIAHTRQSFVHYFISDTAIYILAVTPSSSKFIKQNRKDFNAGLFQFLEICADIRGLNNNYENFALNAYDLYQTLFKPLALPKGRVIICSDAIVIPFEALTTSVTGNDFLINNYQFSYVYSALFLLRNFNNPPGKNNFLGIAPVSYAPYLSLPTLKHSGIALDESSAYFSRSSVLTNGKANRTNLLKHLPDYTIVAILSHARADSTDKEPLLFMADSVVKLSELQQLRNPSAELIILSACQTNVGKIAAGEGIFSLARGFASVGIPSITGTLWKADEESIYDVTKKFLENISKGMRKDDALQKAKLSFLQNGSNKNFLPYYWANMILIGNGEPVTLNKPDNKIWWLTATVSLAVIALIIFIVKKRIKTTSE